MSKKRTKRYNPNNCQRRVIAQFEDAYGNTIALFAHHAFKWCICKTIDGRVIITQMSREEARQEYAKLSLAYKPIKHP